MMNDIFEKAMELQDLTAKASTYCDIINIEVNTAMNQLNESERLNENDKVRNKFFADRYFELVDELVKYGIVQKEWDQS